MTDDAPPVSGGAKMTDTVGLARKAVAYELSMWRSLYRWVLRRPLGPGQPFRYTGTLTPVILAFIGVSAVELPILHLLLPWPTVRLIVDIISVYALLWMIGLLASVRVHPHLVGDAGLRIRQGPTVDLPVPWESVAAVRARHRGRDRKPSLQVEQTAAGAVVSVVVLSQTNVDIELRHPIPLAGQESVIGLRLYADDPAELVTRARSFLLP